MFRCFWETEVQVFCSLSSHRMWKQLCLPDKTVFPSHKPVQQSVIIDYSPNHWTVRRFLHLEMNESAVGPLQRGRGSWLCSMCTQILSWLHMLASWSPSLGTALNEFISGPSADLDVSALCCCTFTVLSGAADLWSCTSVQSDQVCKSRDSYLILNLSFGHSLALDL